MKAAEIRLHIEELLLHGFAPGDRYAIADAVERELSHLLADHVAGQGIPSSLTRSAENMRLDAGPFHVAPSSTPDSIGVQVAQAVHGGLIR